MEELKEFGKSVLAVVIGLIVAVGIGMASVYGFTHFLEHMEREIQSESTN